MRSREARSISFPRHAGDPPLREAIMTQTCPSCGRAADFEDGVCSGCGERLDASRRALTDAPSRAGGRLSGRRGILLALAGIAGVIVLVAAIGSSSRNNLG